jgi:hypothetical protein
MSMSDYLRRKQINAPVVKDTQMRNPDVSSAIWRTKLAVSSVSGVGKHALNEVFDPSKTATSARINMVQSFNSSGFGGRNQDVSNYVMTKAAGAIRGDNFTGGKLQTVTTGSAAGCLTTTPASQVVSESGNAEGGATGLNMGYTLCKYGLASSKPFSPLTQSQFVDYRPDIKRGLGVQSREAWNGATGTHYGSQNTFSCSSVFTQGNAKISNLADGLVPKAVIVVGKPDRPHNPEFAVLQTCRTGDQVGTSNLPGTRATKVGAALRKIPTGINHRGPQPKTASLFTPYRLNNGLRSVPAINNPPGQAV